MYTIIESDQRSPFIGALKVKSVDKDGLLESFYYAPWREAVVNWLDRLDTTLTLYANEMPCCVVMKVGNNV